MADQNVHFLSALVKLGIPSGDYRNHPDFQALPAAVTSIFWNDFKNPPHGLTVFELGALQNVRCSTLSQPPQVESPRLIPCVYILAYKPADTFPVLLGTAWAVECRSQTLLLTACHCLRSTIADIEAFRDNLCILKSISMNDDGSATIEGEIPVRALTGNEIADVAVVAVNDSRSLPERISLCPVNEFPSATEEDQVKTYHCSIQSFPDVSPVCVADATGYTKVTETPHHYFVRAEHMHGSSGGVVVDRRGRAVGLICSGYVPGGVQLPLPDSFQTVWETRTALSEGRGVFTRCVKLSAVDRLYQYLSEK